MRIAVMGAGAVGGYFGARLAAASNDVAFIARGLHLAAMRQEGLTLESPQGNLHIRDALFTDDPTQVGVVDLVLFCVKSYDTDATAAKLTLLDRRPDDHFVAAKRCRQRRQDRTAMGKSENPGRRGLYWLATAAAGKDQTLFRR